MVLHLRLPSTHFPSKTDTFQDEARHMQESRALSFLSCKVITERNEEAHFYDYDFIFLPLSTSCSPSFPRNREGQVEEPMEGRARVQEESEVTRQNMRGTQTSEAFSTEGVLPVPGSSSLCGSHTDEGHLRAFSPLEAT